MPDLDLLRIMLPATVAGLMIAAIHGPLGVEVLRRGIIFIDLAIAQIAGLCVVLVGLWLHEPSWYLTQAAVALAAVLAAAFFHWVEKILPHEQEAIIGSCFILAASAVLLALANHPQGGEEIQHILSGQILFISWSDIFAFLPLYAIATGVWFGAPAVRSGLWFFLLFAPVVTASVQLVGVYVVFASLILPALAANTRETGRARIAITCGAGAVILGIVISTVSDLPTGPVLVLVYAMLAIVLRVFRPPPLARSGHRPSERDNRQNDRRYEKSDESA